MILSPLPRKRIPRIPIGIMLPSGRILEESGEITTVHRTSARVVYTGSPMIPLRVARRVGAIGILVRGKGGSKWVRFQFDGVTVYPGVESLELGALISVRDSAHDLGVRAGSLQGMAFLICRSTLAGFVRIAENEEILPLSELPLGARQHDSPGVYDSLDSFDIRGAYLWGISTLPVPALYSHVRRIHHRELYAETSGFVRATIWLNGAFALGPIPYLAGSSTCFPTGNDRLRRIVLSLDDYRLAIDLGMRVSIDECWIGSKHTNPFDFFGCLMREWRNDPAKGGVGKQVANTLWGSFGSSGVVSEVTIKPGVGKMTVKRYPPRVPRSLSVSASVIGRLRAKVYRGIGSATVHVHTDGLMTSSPGIVTGEEIGDWRFTGVRRNVEILAPGWYAYDINGERIWKTAGRALTPETARRFFDQMRAKLAAGNPPEKEKGIFQ